MKRYPAIVFLAVIFYLVSSVCFVVAAINGQMDVIAICSFLFICVAYGLVLVVSDK